MPSCSAFLHQRTWLVVWFSFFPLIATASCTAGASVQGAPRSHGQDDKPVIQWVVTDPHDEPVLARWRVSVGPPLTRDRISWTRSADAVTIASWNTALGAGDLTRFVSTLSRDRPIVLLLQEVVRGGRVVPSSLPSDARFASRGGGAAAGPQYQDIEVAAAELGL